MIRFHRAFVTVSHKLLRDHGNYGKPTYCVVGKKYMKQKKLNYFNKGIKKHGHVLLQLRVYFIE